MNINRLSPQKHQEEALPPISSLVLMQRMKEHKDRLKLPEERHCRIATRLGQPALHEQASKNRLYFHDNPNSPKSALL